MRRVLNNSYIRRKPSHMQTSSTLQPVLPERFRREIHTVEMLEQELRHQGFAPAEIQQMVELWKKKKRAARYSNGLILIFTGGGVGFMGCLSILFNIAPEYYYWMLYCPTCLACLLICWGLYLIVE